MLSFFVIQLVCLIYIDYKLITYVLGRILGYFNSIYAACGMSFFTISKLFNIK